jgi:hypothetical protein
MMEDVKLVDIVTDEKVSELLETKNYLELAKFLGKELCGFTEDDEKYVDLF